MQDALLEIPAIHEAARAVMCHLLDTRIGCLTIDDGPDAPAVTPAEDAEEETSLPTPTQIRRSRRQAMILCAGDTAAHMHLVRQLRKQGLAGKPTIDRAVGLAVAQLAVKTEHLAQYVDAFLEDTRAELDAHWPQVEKLATALLTWRRLSTGEVIRILNASAHD